MSIQMTSNSSSSKKTTKINDLEEQIRLLETALEQDDDNEDDESEDEDDNGLLVECDAAGNVVRLVSSLVTEKIAPLPASLLPLPMCSRGGGGNNRPKPSSSSSTRMDGKGNGVRFDDESTDAIRSERPMAKRPRKTTSESTSSSSSSKPLSGLESTVMELLSNYQVRSGEGRPFWCRICRTQSTDMDDYNAHMLSEFHRAAVKMERKLSFCTLCKKQFNSPDQLQEHVRGKAHKEFLANRMAKQTIQKNKFS